LFSRRRALFQAILLPLVVLPFFVVFPCSSTRAVSRAAYSWPLEGRILRGFEKPAGHYGEGGHQGVDMAATPGAVVRAAGDGTVAWVGEVPQGRFISIEHAGGTRTVYVDMERVDVARGATVTRGQVIGTACGRRDSSSAPAHLHFGAYLHGHPVDPGLLFNGLGSRAFIRLCPVDRPGGSARSRAVPAGEDRGLRPGFKRGVGGVTSWVARPLASAWRGVRGGFSAAWSGVSASGRWVGRSAATAWNRFIYRGLSAAGRAFTSALRYLWNNRWVQGIVAGLAAALVVVAVIALAVVTLGLSVVVAAVAAIAAAIACVGFAIYYAATHASNFSFQECFLKSMSAGAVAAGLVGSIASLAGAFAAGWAQLGLWGTVKSAFWSGVFSAGFDTSTGYLFTGQFSWKKLLVAFAVGALSGAVGRIVIRGLAPERLVEILSFTASEGRPGIIALGRQAMLLVREGAVTVQGVMLTVKDAAVTLGSKLAYLGFSGTFGVTLNIVVNRITGQPITLSGCLASFVTGVAMGALALSFGVRGVDGLLEKLSIFREGMGRFFRSFAAKLIRKSISRGLDFSLKNSFKRLFGEKEVTR